MDRANYASEKYMEQGWAAALAGQPRKPPYDLPEVLPNRKMRQLLRFNNLWLQGYDAAERRKVAEREQIGCPSRGVVAGRVAYHSPRLRKGLPE